MKKVIFITFNLLLLILSCSGSNDKIPQIPQEEITVSETLLIPNKETKTVTAILNFKNLDQIKYVIVSKSGGNSYTHKISQKELHPGYPFEYKIQKTDPEKFQLIFVAIYNDDSSSKELSVQVDNRWGFFIRKVSCVSRITGNKMENEKLLCPNQTVTNWNVGGTDLGIIWEMTPGKYGLFFGDTYGYDFKPDHSSPGPNGGSWRSNVLAFSEDQNLEDGLTLHSMLTDETGHAREVIYGGKDTSGKGDWTSIPTAAICANGIQYVHYFNLKTWNGWVTNHSGLYKSADNGLTWSECEEVSFSSSSSFAQVGYFKKDGYIYMIGTHSGRDSHAKLARFLEADIENQEKYEYWNATQQQWIMGNEAQATTLINDKVGELSFIYNESHHQWIIAYFNPDRYNITMRTAPAVTGPWSEPYVLAEGKEYPQLYGSFFHPLSTRGDNLFFTMSMWLPYNVFLMKAEIGDMGNF